MVAFFGGLFAKRILQNERAAIESGLLKAGHEFALIKHTFERQRDLLTDYYRILYKHYRLCQRTAGADAFRTPDGTISMTKDEFLKKIDAFLPEWSEQEPHIRLFLPTPMLKVHSNAICAFNEFKKSIDAFDKSEKAHESKAKAFHSVQTVKEEMESGLRTFLRTDHFTNNGAKKMSQPVT